MAPNKFGEFQEKAGDCILFDRFETTKMRMLPRLRTYAFGLGFKQ